MALIKVLDPELEVFEKSYEAAYLEMKYCGEYYLDQGYSNHWFETKETFEGKIQKYFEKESLSTRSREFLKPIVSNLRRIGEKIFDQ